jgi:tetratricopeptide (TPR) repeat protein
LNRLAGNSQSKGDIKKAEEYLDLGNQYVTQGPTTNRLDLMHYYIRAKVCWDKGDFKQAYEFSNRSIQNIKQGTHLEGDDLLSYLRNIMILEKLGHGHEAYVKMQDFYNKYCQAVQDKNFLAIALNAMAEIAKDLGLLDQAEQNITRSLSILEELYENKATRHKAVAYRIFGDICDEKGLLTKAQGNYLKSEDLYKEIFKVFEIDEISDLYAKLAINSAKLKNPHATLHYLDTHKSLFGKTHKRTFEIINYLNDHNLPF